MEALRMLASALLFAVLGGLSLVASLSLGVGGSQDLASAPLHCVTGAAARNPTEPNAVRSGETITLPTNETFASVSEAEAFICLRVPYPRVTGDWVLVNAQAERSNSLAQFVDGKGYRAVEVFYRNATTRTQFSLRVQPGAPGTIVGPGPPRPFTIGAIEGTLRQRPPGTGLTATFALDWQQGGFWFTASGAGNVQPQDILPVLESIR